MNSESHLTYGM